MCVATRRAFLFAQRAVPTSLPERDRRRGTPDRFSVRASRRGRFLGDVSHPVSPVAGAGMFSVRPPRRRPGLSGSLSCRPWPERFLGTFFVPVSPSLPLPAGFKHLCRLRPTSRPFSGEKLAGALTSDKHYPSQTEGSFYHNIRFSLIRSQCRLLPFFSLIG